VMHEFGIALSILDLLSEEIGRRSGGSPKGRVPSLTVRVGSFSGVEPEALSFAWDVAREQGPFPEAKLHLETHPARAACSQCGAEFELGRGEGSCERCGPAGFRLGDGREIELRQIVWVPEDELAEDETAGDARARDETTLEETVEEKKVEGEKTEEASADE